MPDSRQNEPFVFHLEKLIGLAKKHHNSYISAKPFPHVVIDDFLDLPHANRLLKAFPHQKSDVWLDWKGRDTIHQPRKQGIGHAFRLQKTSPHLQAMLAAFNSFPFLHFLERLTGIGKLLPNPYLHGGGIHQTLSGGKLAIHTDFNHIEELDIYRRINVIFFLNKNWEPEYRGELEIWDEEAKGCEKSIMPIFNRMVIFNTNKKSFHGHPAPLNTPQEISRKSLALYYYTAKPKPEDIYDGNTDWKEG